MAQSSPASGASIRPTDPSKNWMQPPIPIHHYVGDYIATLDAKRLRLMPSSLRHQVHYQRGVARLSPTGVWAKRWAHWSFHAVLSTEVSRADRNIPYVLIDEESVYFRMPSEMLDSLYANPRTTLVH